MDKRRLLLIGVCAFATAYTLQIASRQLRRSAGLDARATVAASSVPPASRSLRPNYPYSVVPGGVYSPAELRYAVERDHLVNSHYGDFDLRSAHLVTLTDDRLQYVSYRLKDKIFWTRNRLRIPKGEVLLTDGHNFARTRCGNRLSSKPGPETALDQPSERLLNLPPFTPALLKTGLVTLAPPPAVQLAQGGPALPLDLPRLTPYIPADETLASPQVWPALQSYPPGSGLVAAGPPMGPGYLPVYPGSPVGPGQQPGAPTGAGQQPGSPAATTPIITGVLPLPVVTSPVLPVTPLPPDMPITPIPPGLPEVPISYVPEPASLSLMAVSFFGWFWLVTRAVRSRKAKSA